MTVTWILESNVFAEACFDEMLAHLENRRLPHHVVRIVPFINEVDGITPEVSGPIVVYGSIGIQKLAQRQGWKPGVFTNADFATSAYKQLGDLFLNHDAVSMPMSAVEQWLLTYEGEHFFIKPDGDNKEFAGTVMSRNEFARWHSNMLRVGYLESNDFDVVISTPKSLGCEWRVVVVDGRLVTSSLYKQWGIVKAERHIIPEVEAAVLEAHKRFVPAPAYVIDVAQADDAYKIIEYNTLNSAGFYDCDVSAIIDAVTDLVDRVRSTGP